MPAGDPALQPQFLLLARVPRPGHGKTRLARSLGADRAVELQTAFLGDTLQRLATLASGSGAQLTVAFDASPDLPADLRASLRQARIIRQQGGDLGQRLLAAHRTLLAGGGPCRLLTIGADSPTLPAAHFRLALDELRRHDVALAPALDGGYTMLAVNKLSADLFDRIPWGGPEVLAVTLRRAARAGLSVAMLPPWHDVDDEAGLALLRHELQGDARRRAPRTAALLARW